MPNSQLPDTDNTRYVTTPVMAAWIEQARAAAAQQERRYGHCVLITGLETWPLIKAMGDTTRLTNQRLMDKQPYRDGLL